MLGSSLWINGLLDDRAKYARYFIGWIDGFVDEQHIVTSLGWIEHPPLQPQLARIPRSRGEINKEQSE